MRCSPARLRRVRHRRSTTTAAPTARANRQLATGIWPSLREAAGWCTSNARSRTALRPGAEDVSWPTVSSKASARSCGAAEQYGDSCEKCGSTYSPADLIAQEHAQRALRRPGVRGRARSCSCASNRCTRSSTTGRRRAAHLQPRSPTTSPGTSSASRCRDWDVSRPAPYFGFEIPDSEGQLLVRLVRRADRLHGGDQGMVRAHRPVARGLVAEPAVQEVEIHHFIGKDITYFHTLFWPALLQDGRATTCRRSAFTMHGFLHCRR